MENGFQIDLSLVFLYQLEVNTFLSATIAIVHITYRHYQPIVDINFQQEKTLQTHQNFSIEDFERFSLGFGVVEVNSDKIDDGEVTKDFDEDLKKILKLYCIVTFRVQLFFRQY